MKRVLTDEILDSLPADNPKAAGARRDLRVLNAVMRHRSFFRKRILEMGLQRKCKTIVEIGAGDGSLLLRLAEAVPWEHPVEARIIDQYDLVSQETRSRFSGHGWNVIVIETELFDWIESPEATRLSCDLVLVNLFLHHFTDAQLKGLFKSLARLTDCLMACEPQRSGFAKLSARFVGLLGCNSVTRHDARVSVNAGFRNAELSSLWPDGEDWILTEQTAGLFSHFFSATRRNSPEKA